MTGDLMLMAGGIIALSLTHMAMWRDGYRSGQIEAFSKAKKLMRD